VDQQILNSVVRILVTVSVVLWPCLVMVFLYETTTFSVWVLVFRPVSLTANDPSRPLGPKPLATH
jgi:hypothetical protein